MKAVDLWIFRANTKEVAFARIASITPRVSIVTNAKIVSIVRTAVTGTRRMFAKVIPHI